MKKDRNKETETKKEGTKGHKRKTTRRKERHKEVKTKSTNKETRKGRTCGR